MQKQTYLAIFSALFMTGCANVSAPIAMPNGQYLLTTDTDAGLRSSSALLQKSLKKADQFCSAQHAKIKIIHTLVTGTEMFSQQSNQVIFECIKTDYVPSFIESVPTDKLKMDKPEAKLPAIKMGAPTPESLQPVNQTPELH